MSLDLNKIRNRKRPDFDGYTCDEAWDSGRYYESDLLAEVESVTKALEKAASLADIALRKVSDISRMLGEIERERDEARQVTERLVLELQEWADLLAPYADPELASGNELEANTLSKLKAMIHKTLIGSGRSKI